MNSVIEAGDKVQDIEYGIDERLFQVNNSLTVLYDAETCGVRATKLIRVNALLMNVGGAWQEWRGGRKSFKWMCGS